MAITDTKKAKDFTAGAPDITLKGDLTPTKMASAPDTMDSLNDLSQMLFGKNLDQLTDEEYDALQDAARDSRAAGGRAQYGLGSLVKSVKKAVKGVVKGVKDNPLLAAAALNFAPMLIPGGSAKPFFGLGSLKGSVATLPGFSNILGLKEGADAMNALKVGGTGAVITGLLAKREELSEEDPDFAERRAQVNDQLNVQFKRLYPKGEAESDQDYEVRINAMVEAADDSTVPVGEMAEGGRVGYAMGTDDKVEMAAGIEGLPININPKGVKELDLRETGGFIPPVGVKEKADDIPAMLSNNEFVFTADAVRAAGGGSVNKGAQRLYDTMKQLESKVV